MPYLKLGEKDRERLGAPERIPMDVSSLTNREVIQLRTLGYNTPRIFRKALLGKPVDVDGNRIDRKDASSADEDVFDYELDYAAWTAFVWLALRRVGVETDPKTLVFDVDAMDYQNDEPEPVVDEGKAPEDPEPSTS